MNRHRFPFSPAVVNTCGVLLLAGLAALLAGTVTGAPGLQRTGVWLAAPFLALLAIALLVLAPYHWLTDVGRRRRRP